MALFEAVRHNDEARVARELEFSFSVNEIDPESGRTALFDAVARDNLKIAEMLLLNGADANIDKDILCMAVSKRSARMAHLLLIFGAKFHFDTTHTRDTALFLAIQSNQTDIALLLLFYGAGVSLSDRHSMILLQAAIDNDNRILTNCLSNCKCTSYDKFRFDSLYLAAKVYSSGSKKVNKKRNYFSQITLRYTDPLHIAIIHGDSKIVELYRRNGSKSNITTCMYLHYVIYKRFKEMAMLLLDMGFAKISDCNINGLTALHIAVIEGHVDMIKLCLNFGADVNGRDLINNMSSLHYATISGNRRVVKLLLDNGADYNERRCNCEALMDKAFILKHEAICRLFIERGAVINVSTTNNEATNMAIKLLTLFNFTKPNITAKYNLDNIWKTADQRSYRDLCLQELKEMRSLKIFGDVTFDDLMSPNPNKNVATVRNEDFGLAFLHSGYRQRFPIYSRVLTIQYAEARARGVLLRKAEEGFENLEKFKLPTLCAQMILQYLDNEELKDFIRGICKCKDKHTCEPKVVIYF